MHLSDTEAAQRVADNDNLVGELVEALRGAANYIDVLGGDSKKYRGLIAKAQGAQQ